MDEIEKLKIENAELKKEIDKLKHEIEIRLDHYDKLIEQKENLKEAIELIITSV